MTRKVSRTLTLIAVLLCTACTALKRCSYEGFDRDAWQQPDRVVRALGIRPGDRVADLGSGGGYFTFRLASAVGPEGRVYAVDVDEGLNDYVRERAREEGRTNVEVIRARYDDPLLPEGGVDLIFLSNAYHHIDDRPSYFRNAQRYLRPGGRIAIVEFNGQGWLEGWFGHYTPAEMIEEEIEAAGYRLDERFDFLPKQSFLVFSQSSAPRRR